MVTLISSSFLPTYPSPPSSLSTPRPHFSNGHETHFSHQYSFSAHSHPFLTCMKPYAWLPITPGCPTTHFSLMQKNLHAWPFSFPSHTTNQEEGTRRMNPNNQRCGSGKPSHFPTLSLFRNLFPKKKKKATKVPIGVGLSLASPPCASNVRSLVLKSAFFGHGA